MKRQIVRDLELIIGVNELTYEEVAREINMSYSTFASLMSRDMYPRKENLRKVKDYIAKHLERSKLKEKYLPIKIYIRLKDRTIAEAALGMGISAKHLQDAVDGKAEPSKLTLIAIENWMGHTLESVNRIKAECRLAEKLEDEIEQQKKARQAKQAKKKAKS